MTSRNEFAGNVSPSTNRTFEKRFDYEPRDEREPSDDERAKSAFWQMPIARKDVLRFWAKHALSHSRSYVGWAYDEPSSGTTSGAALASVASDDCGFTVEPIAVVGACLFERRLVTVSSRGKPYARWEMSCQYGGIPLSRQADFDDLKAAA
jgi:hypothetical protein